MSSQQIALVKLQRLEKKCIFSIEAETKTDTEARGRQIYSLTAQVYCEQMTSVTFGPRQGSGSTSADCETTGVGSGERKVVGVSEKSRGRATVLWPRPPRTPLLHVNSRRVIQLRAMGRDQGDVETQASSSHPNPPGSLRGGGYHRTA